MDDFHRVQFQYRSNNSEHPQSWVVFTAMVKAYRPARFRTLELLRHGSRPRPNRLWIKSVSSQRRAQLHLRSVLCSGIRTVSLRSRLSQVISMVVAVKGSKKATHIGCRQQNPTYPEVQRYCTPNMKDLVVLGPHQLMRFIALMPLLGL